MYKLMKVFWLIVLVGLVSGCSTAPEAEEPIEQPASEEVSDIPELKESLQKASEEETQPAEVEPAEPADREPVKVDKEKEVDIKPSGPNPALTNPSLANETAPANFKVKFETTKGDVVIDVDRSWAPQGADRFYNLVKIGYFEDVAFFRVIEGFMAQFGLHGDPEVTAAWRRAQIQDDPVKQSNARGYISFATAGPNTRTTQLFINFGDNSMLDSQGFAPFGKVVEGMEVIDSLFKGYGEGAPRGRGPSQQLITQQGNGYLKQQFPQLDYLEKATLLP